MNRIMGAALVPLLAWLAFEPALAAQEAVNSKTQVSEQQGVSEEKSQQTTSIEQLAKPWGLTAAEWERFEALKQQPRGYWSPGLDPLTALGMEATTEAERQRYAELQVKLEVARVERELAYQRAYNAAFARLYPDTLLIQDPPQAQTSSFSNLLKNGVPPGLPLPSAEGRYRLFVKEGCADCVQQARMLQRLNEPFDLYMLGTNGDDHKVRRFATEAGIREVDVKTKKITLNHDGGLWQSGFSEQAAGQLPATFVWRGGQWQRSER